MPKVGKEPKPPVTVPQSPSAVKNHFQKSKMKDTAPGNEWAGGVNVSTVFIHRAAAASGHGRGGSSVARLGLQHCRLTAEPLEHAADLAGRALQAARGEEAGGRLVWGRDGVRGSATGREQ